MNEWRKDTHEKVLKTKDVKMEQQITEGENAKHETARH